MPLFGWHALYWIRDVAPLALMWSEWREMNKRAFEGVEKDSVHLRNSLFSLISFWCTRGPYLYRWLGIFRRKPCLFVRLSTFWYTYCIRARFLPSIHETYYFIKKNVRMFICVWNLPLICCVSRKLSRRTLVIKLAVCYGTIVEG